ncbi:uncharacterized protein LOC114517256 [Dendronephthya gigantea]|uniref:uncharacterized protein LOC114517256 n=1 Tax=Dendronephthya gigantea TaxID=151771 RepID=UPI00106CD8C0|nr:uncharacterized protein LOC114517256 [Dendronephthya gigantea]
MARIALTLLAIFLVLNKFNFSETRSVEMRDEEKDREKREASEIPKSVEVHSREKRGAWGNAFRLGAGLSFAASTGVTIYTEITKCNDFKPTSCKTPPCRYVNCPDVCTTPDVNDAYIRTEKDKLKKKLDVMDKLALDTYQLATDGISANIDLKRIFTAIENINGKVERFMFQMIETDRNLTYNFLNRTKEIQSLLRDYRFSLDDILGRGPVQGMFDKWTWEDDGLLALSIALPLGAKMVEMMKQRIAINKMYNHMRADIINKAKQSLTGSSKARAVKLDMFVKSIQNPLVDKQIRQSAKMEYKAQVAQKQPSKWGPRINGAINVAVTVLSIYSTWKQIDACQSLANEMQDRAYDLAVQSESIEKTKVTEILPLQRQVKVEVWDKVKDILTSENITDWLEEIKNLTLNAENANATTADTIQYFIDNIAAAGVKRTLQLEISLIYALKSVGYKYDCLGDKLHAINIVLKDCRMGRDKFERLFHSVAVEKNELNRKDCVNDKQVPYTSMKEFRKILKKFAEHEGWNENCLLNSDDFLFRVCNKFYEGYTDHNTIVSQLLNYTQDLTTAMVADFLTRCPDPKITPKSIETTCTLYCSFETIPNIAPHAILKESQVEMVIQAHCPICAVKVKDVRKICHQHYCKSKNITKIVNDVEIPLPTVQFVIANNCSSKCIIYDVDVKKEICEESECKGLTSSAIAEKVDYPKQAVDDVIPNCRIILPTCPPLSPQKKNLVCFFHCIYETNAKIAGRVTLKESRVADAVKECGICEVSSKNVKKICHLHYCKSAKIQDIMDDVEKPLKTVRFIIANNCSSKCIVEDLNMKKRICEDNICKKRAASTIATEIAFPVQAVNDVISNCNTILPKCPGIDDKTKAQIKTFACDWGQPAASVASHLDLPVAEVQKVIDELGC